MSIISHYVKTGVFTAFSKALVMLSALLMLWISTDYLGKEDFGLFIYAYTITSMLAVIISAPFCSIILYKISRLEKEGRDVAAWNLVAVFVVSLAFTALLCLAAKPLADWIGKPDLAFWFFWLSLIIPLDAFRQVQGAWQQAQKKPIEMVLFQELMPFLLRLAFLAFIYVLWPGNPSAFLAAYFLSYIFPVVAAYIRNPAFREGISLQKIVSWWDVQYGFKSMGIQIVHRPIRNIDIIILGFYATSEIVADYATATRLALLLMTGKEILMPLFIPRMGYLMERRERMELIREFNLLRDFTIFFTMCGAIFFMFFGSFLLGVIGPYEGAYPLLLLMCAAMFIRMVNGASGDYLRMLGYAGWTMIAVIPGLIFLIVAALWLVPVFSEKGAALAYIGSMIIINLLVALFIYQRDEKFNVWSMPYILLSIVFCGALVACSFEMISLIAGVLILCGCLVVFGLSRRSEIAYLFDFIALERERRRLIKKAI